MKRPRLAVVGALFVAGGIVLGWRWGGPERQVVSPPVAATHESRAVMAKKKDPAAQAQAQAGAVELTAPEKAARIEKIKRDYDEMRAKIGADYTAAGALYPESVPAFLRQLALLERERRADFAAVLTTEELEEIEWRETAAGKRVRQLLHDTAATDAQRSAVFRLQRDYDERFALSFDVTPAALWERETARQETQEKIRLVLGDGWFASWLRGDGDGYVMFSDYVTKRNLPGALALELWRIKNDFTREQLELRANSVMSAERRRGVLAVLVQQSEARVAILVGQDALERERAGVWGWLPRR